MRILLIRHGDPDYVNDSLTKTGKKEAELLANRLKNEKIDKIYCSPLGRAKKTAEPTAKALSLDVTYCDWLREFSYATVETPYTRIFDAPWDFLPQYMNEHPELYDVNGWQESPIIKNSDVFRFYNEVIGEFDALLEKHGYKREGMGYKVIAPNHDTIALFCHYGVISVLMSRIMNCSPYSFWQNGCVLTTSVTEVYTEERREGIASLRACAIGDLSHVRSAGDTPSFSARFCECFTDETRHD